MFWNLIIYVVFGDIVEVCFLRDIMGLKRILSESIFSFDLVGIMDFFVGGVCR